MAGLNRQQKIYAYSPSFDTSNSDKKALAPLFSSPRKAIPPVAPFSLPLLFGCTPQDLPSFPKGFLYQKLK